jgi:hypothetical protein
VSWLRQLVFGPLTAEAQVRVNVSLSGICGGQSDTITGFSRSSSSPPPPTINIIPPWLSVLIYHLWDEQGLLEDAVQRYSFTSSTWRSQVWAQETINVLITNRLHFARSVNIKHAEDISQMMNKNQNLFTCYCVSLTIASIIINFDKNSKISRHECSLFTGTV